MSLKLLQVNLKFSMSKAELESVQLEAAKPIADSPHSRWKVWLLNGAEHEAGGVYLFDNEAAARLYLVGPFVAAVKSSPAISNISAKLFDVLEGHTAITRGQVKQEIALYVMAGGMGDYPVAAARHQRVTLLHWRHPLLPAVLYDANKRT